MDKSKRYYQNLCVKDICGETNHREKRSLKKWLKINPKNQKFYQELQSGWEEGRDQLTMEIADKEKQWQIVAARLGLRMKPHKQKTRKSRAQILWQPKLRPVYGFALAMLIGLNIFINRYSHPSTMIHVAANYGEKQTIILSDGSTIHMNSGSSIEYQDNFSYDQRLVTLSGEAFFEVTKETRPFVVATSNAETRVLGTKFNVWDRNHETRVIVKIGKVCLRPKGKDNSIILTANKSSRVTESKLDTSKTIDAEYHLGWLKDKLIFEQAPLHEIINELERTYNVKISLIVGSMKHKTLSACYENAPVETILLSISHALKIQMIQKNEHFILTTQQ